MGNIHCSLRHAGAQDIIAFRGSVDGEDWLRDFKGWPRKHQVLGYCHSGFLEGMNEVAVEISPPQGAMPFIITGHSLGAARALIVAALLAARGKPPLALVTFGTPRPGMAQLSAILIESGFPIRCYRNGEDPVTEVPLALAPLWLYQKPVLDIMLDVAPPLEAHDILRWHDIALYVRGIRQLVEA